MLALDTKSFSQHLRQVMPKLRDFCELRRELDPQGMFLNEYTKELFVD